MTRNRNPKSVPSVRESIRLQINRLASEVADTYGITLNSHEGYDIQHPSGPSAPAVAERIKQYGLWNDWYALDHNLGIYHASLRDLRDVTESTEAVLTRGETKELRTKATELRPDTRTWAEGMAHITSKCPRGILTVPQGIEVKGFGHANCFQWSTRSGSYFGYPDSGPGLLINTYEVKKDEDETLDINAISGFAFHFSHADKVAERIQPTAQRLPNDETRAQVIMAIREQMNIILSSHELATVSPFAP